VFIPMACSPCCSPQPAPCPVAADDVTAVEVDLRSGGEFKVLSNVGDGEVVFQTDFTSMTGTFSLTETSTNVWRYSFPARADGVQPYIEFRAANDTIALWEPPSQGLCKSYNGSTYTTFTSCWTSGLASSHGPIRTSACSRTYPVVAWNSALVEGQNGSTTNLAAGSGGYAQARHCTGGGFSSIPWTSSGRTGDANIYFDALRIYT